MRRALALGGVTGLGVVAAHAAPVLTSVGAVRRTLTPSMAGIGSPGHVALTFDDGPDPVSTPLIMEALAERGVQATFFLLGSMTRKARGLAAELVAAGHEVAVHGDVHRSHLWRSAADVKADVTRARDAIADATGVMPARFRPPYGVVSGGSLRAAGALGLELVLWTTWGRDWRGNASPAAVVADVDAGLGPGGTILLHDSDCTSAPGSWRSTLGAVPLVLDLCESRGLAVGPLSEHAT